MSDEELIARLRAWDGTPFDDDDNAADDRIEALVKYRDDAVLKRAAWELEAKTQQARAERLEAALLELIDHTHNCEKELTEELHHADFCGESLPLTNARTALKGAKP